MKDITIDFVVLTKNCPSVEPLLKFIKENKNSNDTLWVLDDCSDPQYVELYKKHAKYHNHQLDMDYSAHRNSILSKLKSNYSFFMDDDESFSPTLFKNLKHIIRYINYPDLILIPRKNIFKGALPIHALKYNWELQGEVVNWMRGDYQTRFFKNGRGLKWSGRLHERIIPNIKLNHKAVQLERGEENCIYHHKTITEQIQDNDRYNERWTIEENSGIGQDLIKS